MHKAILISLVTPFFLFYLVFCIFIIKEVHHIDTSHNILSDNVSGEAIWLMTLIPFDVIVYVGYLGISHSIVATWKYVQIYMVVTFFFCTLFYALIPFRH